MINFVYEGSTLLPWKLEVSFKSELEMTKTDTESKTSGLTEQLVNVLKH